MQGTPYSGRQAMTGPIQRLVIYNTGPTIFKLNILFSISRLMHLTSAIPGLYSI